MSLSTITTMGYEVGSLGLITTLGYGQGARPPKPSAQQPYGPALTEWERRRWFGDFTDPEERKRRQKELERARRLELGIIKALPPLKAEIRSEVQEVVRERVLTTMPSVISQPIRLDKEVINRIAREISLDLRAVLKEGRQLREIHRLRELKRLEDEEEEEAIEAATLFMLH